MFYSKSMKLANSFYMHRKIIIWIQGNSLISILPLRFGFVVLFFNEYWIRFRCLAFLSPWRWFNFFGRHTSLPSLSRWVFEPRRALQFPLVSAEINGLWGIGCWFLSSHPCLQLHGRWIWDPGICSPSRIKS